ncbi:MAG: shikimate dehydrogenase, partial [Comamonadaceae bacterium]
MITGRTQLLPLLGDPTETVKSPMIYNPWFSRHGIDAVVVPMAVRPGDYATTLRQMLRIRNVRGALVTMPHKVRTLELVDAATPVARVAGACNAVIRRADGTLLGDQFDGAGFVRGAQVKGLDFKGTRVIVAGAGGV